MQIQESRGYLIDKLNEKSKEIHHLVIQWRRQLHKYPELSFQEKKTAQFVYDTLKSFPGLEVTRPTETGVVAKLLGSSSGKTIALRADMDALPITEDTGLPFQSTVDGVMHACGHDGHTAVLLGVAKILSELRYKIKGEVRFIFQPAEEVGGAPKLINTGILEGVDKAFGIHLWTPIDVGKLGIVYGPAMATGDRFNITIYGKGGHAAMPQNSIDPIAVGTEIVSNLQIMITRNMDPLDEKLLSITKFNAGNKSNIIPNTATISGTIRALDSKVIQKMRERIRKITKGICEAHDASFECEFHWEKIEGASPVINNQEVTSLVEETIIESFGEQWVEHVRPTLAGEDFAFYTTRVPSCFLFVGARNIEKDIIYPHHHPKFDIDENSLEHGVRVFIQFIRKLLM